MKKVRWIFLCAVLVDLLFLMPGYSFSNSKSFPLQVANGADSRFGIFTRLFDLAPADIPQGGQAAQAAQAGLFMENFEWEQIQPTATTWDWTKADAVLAALPANVPLAVELFLVPGWANDNRGDYAPPMTLYENEKVDSLSSTPTTLSHAGALDWLDVVTTKPTVIYHPGVDYVGDLTTGSIRRTATSSIPDGATVYCKFLLPSSSGATRITGRAVTLHGTDWAVVETGWTPESDDMTRKAVASFLVSSVKMAEVGTDYMMRWGDPSTIEWVSGSSLPEGSTVYVSYYVINPAPMADFARACVQRYGSRIKQWQIWDEPDYMWEVVPNPENYGILAKACGAAIKSADSAAQVLVGATAGSGINQDFLTKIMAYVGTGNVDVITFHSFGGSPEMLSNGLSLYQQIVNLDGAMTALGFTQPFWNTSFGWRTGTGEITEADQANYLVRSFVQMAAVPRVKGAAWFCLADFGGADYTHGLMTIDFKPKPSYNAFRVMSGLLANVPFHERLDLGSNNRIGAVFAAPDLKITVLWLVGNSETLTLPVTYPNASQVSLYGDEIPLPVKDGQVTMTLSTKPLYLVEWQGNAHSPAYSFAPQNDDVFVYPNPSRGKINLLFHMDQPGEVKVQVYNIKGELVSTINEQAANAGYHTSVWDSESLAAGVYLVRITAAGSRYQVKKVAHLR